MSVLPAYFGIDNFAFPAAECGATAPSASIFSPADVVRRLMIDIGLVTNPDLDLDWPAYVAQEPGDRGVPDEVVTFYDTQGRDFGSHLGGERLEYRGFQIRVRARDHYRGYPKARQLAEAMDTDILGETVVISDNVTYCVHSINRTSDVVCLGKDVSTSSKRSLFTVNGTVVLKLIT